ncbi:MAG TPA: hypothetical protein VGS19_27510 [Streptosporangiaceae bacterium]|nr:hypothetical protein [Streptosporangiaceae bacterium]
MHPTIDRLLIEQHQAEVAKQVREARLGRRRRRRAGASGPGRVPAQIPGVFLDEAEAFGLRAYLTPDEARQIRTEWSRTLARFADRLGDPRRRPADAVPFEVVVLGRSLQEPVHAGVAGPCAGEEAGCD